MKQILQNLRDGSVDAIDVPAPALSAATVRVRTSVSVISPGTERMLVEFGSASLIGKARSQPERVRQVLEKIRTDGLTPTLDAVFRRLDEPIPLGYSNVGEVSEVGRDASGLAVGDRVVSNGPHAEVVAVPANLAARIPDAVDDESAGFAVLGSIALNGIRLLSPTLGETFVVYGLGLLGQLAVQLLRAHGCRVLAIEPNADRCELARSFGADTFCNAGDASATAFVESATDGNGADGVLITASAKTDAIAHEAAVMCRKKGRIVLVGVVGLSLNRADFYEKELSFQVACSYGPGRYDPTYENLGQDYPEPWVRWTVRRNLEAVLGAIEAGSLDVKPLISARFPFEKAREAYAQILNDPATLGAVLEYPRGQAALDAAVQLKPSPAAASPASAGGVGLIGAGLFTRATLAPALAAADANVRKIASAGGVSAADIGRKIGAAEATTDYRSILSDDAIDVVFITTRHDLHARLVVEALDAGKHVFVEKPLALDPSELARVREAKERNPDRQLLVGFNRRFAPHSIRVRELLSGRSEPVAIRMLVNAGAIPADSWVQDPDIGGGRIIGEACHFIDLARFLAGASITATNSVSFSGRSAALDGDKTAIQLSFADGSIASIDYLANGHRSYPKETIEVFSEGRILVIDNWRRLRSHGWKGVPRMWKSQDKGHETEIQLFLERVRSGGDPLIPLDELIEVTESSFAAASSSRP